MPLKSKKFVAYLLAEFGWKACFFYVCYAYKDKLEHYSFTLLITIVITSGFIQVGYILGQAALDRYSLIAEKAISHDSRDKKDVQRDEKDT
jgi:hypothetical protein